MLLRLTSLNTRLTISHSIISATEADLQTTYTKHDEIYSAPELSSMQRHSRHCNQVGACMSSPDDCRLN
ncbi:hypothetical protein HYQ46_004181 [Verticillium longisporum]|nr:hypothetical protein HYQ44_013229 [Verticillium longisporum]KAG7147016.1 hypothetical protein HYQ46_004181 [Verticillium longisporum]